MENQIPLTDYQWEYFACADECEEAGPTLIYYNLVMTAEEKSQMYQELKEHWENWIPIRAIDYNIHS